MNIRSIFLLLIIISITSYGQKNTFTVADNITLPRDTIVKRELLTSLNGFISQINLPNKENSYVLNSDLLETSVLLDEMKGMGENRALHSDNFYKAYLTYATRVNDSIIQIKLSYMGVMSNTPILRACFTLIAEKKRTQFYFRSPLKQNTVSWKKQTFNNTNVYFKNTLNTTNAQAYFTKIAEYDKKLNAPKQSADFYCANNFAEALQLIGVDYKSDYNGYAYNYLTAQENNNNLNVNGLLTSDFTQFDPHDLWHERLHNIISTAIINKPVDEGAAYLYGGSWGLSWKDILEKFRSYTKANKNADWLTLYNESKNFEEQNKPPLNVDFVINALLIQKIEKEKGFASVIKLLSCGKKEQGNENYFKALETITGITKNKFNASVWALVGSN